MNKLQTAGAATAFFFLATVCATAAEPGSVPATLSLDGQWGLLFDPDNQGRDAGWFRSEVFSAHPAAREVLVPAAWELEEQDYEGVAFYRREFEVPAEWKGQAVRLQFDAVNYVAEVWVNDQVVGFHEGGFTPFAFRVDELIDPGKTNTVTLRVLGPLMLREARFDGIGRLETPQWRGGLTGGIWQSVRLVATPSAYFEDVFIEPRRREGSVELHASLSNPGPQAAAVLVSLTIREAGGEVVAKRSVELTLQPGLNDAHWRLEIPNAKPWTPNSPNLYRVDAQLVVDESLSDRWTHRFGMRELTLKESGFELNGEPVFIKAAFFEGLYPRKIATPDSVEMARREIRLAKEAGFNTIRPWRHPPVRWWLELADEMGVMVLASPAVECMTLPASSPQLASRVEREIRQTVLHNRNHACIVQWELFNEIQRPVLSQLMRPMALAVRTLDPTRLILDESGGFAAGANLYAPYEREPTKFNDVHTYPGPFPERSRYDGFLGIGLTEAWRKEQGIWGRPHGRNLVPGLVSFVSELGYGSLPDLEDANRRFREKGNPLAPAYRYHKRLEEDQNLTLRESGFAEMYPRFSDFVRIQQDIHGAANRWMIEAARSNPGVAGYCVHALIGGDWVLGAGLLDLWRQPKGAAYTQTQAANRPRVLAVRALPGNAYTDKPVELRITGVNDLTEAAGTLAVEVTNGNGDSLLNWRTEASLPSGIHTLLNERVPLDEADGEVRVTAEFRPADGTPVAEGEAVFFAVHRESLAPPMSRVAVLDPTGRLQRFLKEAGVAVEPFDENTPPSVPVLATRPKQSNKSRKTYSTLAGFARAGGVVAYLEPVASWAPFQKGTENRFETEWFPFRPRVQRAQGLWTCIPHLVHDHPLFAGLPSGGPMREAYRNVWAINTLREMPGKAVVASIGFDWYNADHTLQYLGPGESWWGSDLSVAPLGEGTAIVSQLRLVPNVGKDPVADRLLFNLIRFANRLANPADSPRKPLANG